MVLSAAITRFAHLLAFLVGWKRLFVSLAFGMIAATAQPPLFYLPALIISFTGLAWLLNGSTTFRSAFYVGWMFGAGYFGAGLYWISEAFLVDATRHAWLIPLSIFALSFGLGLFGGFATALARLLWSPGLGCSLSLGASWALFELIRGIVFTGFPWNPIGNVWVFEPTILQTAAWTGVYGLSALTIFVATGFSIFGSGSKRKFIYAFSGVGLLCALSVAGKLRIDGVSLSVVSDVLIRVVQPNIPQKKKWQPQHIVQNYADHLTMSGHKGDGVVTHIIWPEAAVPNSILTDPQHRQSIRRAIPPGGYLVTGTPRLVNNISKGPTARNSLVVIDSGGAISAVYDKHHLVPFGKYIPFRDILPLKKLTAGAIDFSAGPGLITLKLESLPAFSPLICYEAIFPGRVALLKDRPEWLLNLTNDAWFGRTAGPHQHLASAVLRAVEEGLPLVRAANTGISAIVDPYGRVTSRLGIGEKGVIDSPLPAPAPNLTFFAKFGNKVPILIVIIMFFGAFMLKNIHRRE
ncbi:MAG: apolipoprotein N-acyltransferase [Rhodospirillaceae bacterium]|nr:apolipoprotein N-acyltransferase [Rhodospirillaceae bacterium]